MKRTFLLILTALAASGWAHAQYWQQQVNYTIDVALDDTAHALDGSISIQYINHSPDTLKYIWIHCWPNAYKNDRTAFSEQRIGNGKTDFYFSSPAQRGYINRLEFRVDGQLARMEDHPRYIDIIKVILPIPLAPGRQTVLTTPFHVQLPNTFSRSGYYQGAYSMAQWYPKPAVYDSHGWHPIPYLDQGEFYSEFGDFDVHITVPKSFVVAATGEWQDSLGSRQQLGPPPSPFTASTTRPIRSTIHPAQHPIAQSNHPAHPTPSATRPTHSSSHSTSHSIAHSAPPAHPLVPRLIEPTKTLHYHQRQIGDFAWFADRRFHTAHDTLQLTSGRIIDVYSYYTPAATPAWQHSLQDIKDAIRFRSAAIGEYPFNVVTAVQMKMGFAGGMEYPTITSINVDGGAKDLMGDAKDLDLTIEHEVGHNWFYAVLGSNERRYPWMDEGINTYYDNRYLAWKYPGRPAANPDAPHPNASHPPAPHPTSRTAHPTPSWLAKKLPDNLWQVEINTLAALREDQPISTPSGDFTAKNYNFIAYAKTGIWMKEVEDSLSTPLFDSSMHEYFRDWQFRHPYPEDLETTFANTSHRRVDGLFAQLDATGPLLPPRKIQPTLLFNFRNTARKDYLNILPAAGYNDYDHFMVGMLIHNYNLPPEPWQILVAPLYATGSHQVNGILHFNYAWYPRSSGPAPSHAAFRMIEAGVNASRFSTLSGVDSNSHNIFGGFYKVVPYVRFYFPKPYPRSTRDSWLEWKTYLIGEKNLGNYVLRTADSMYYPTAGKYEFRYLNQLSYTILDRRVLYPYKVTLQVQQAAPFYRINLNTNYFFNYPTGGGLDVRLFGSKFGYLGGINPSQDLTSFEPKLTAVRGSDDYTYDNYFIGRNEFNGFASQQIMERDGFLKLRTDLFQGLQGRSDDWVASINLTTTLPPKIVPTWLPLRLFLDIGTYAQAWQSNPTTSHFLYVGGAELSLLHDIFRIYAPLVYSSDFSHQLKSVPGQNNFFHNISFSINFENIPFRELFGYTPF